MSSMAQLTTAEIIKKRKKNRRKATILLNPDLKHEIEELVQDIQTEEGMNRKSGDLSGSKLPEMRRRLADLFERAKAESAVFWFQDIGREAFVDLIKEHPATDETKQMFAEHGEDAPEYEPATFVPALMHACAVDPPISEEEAVEILTTWSEGDLDEMFMAAYMACRDRTSIPFSEAGIEPIGNTEPSSTTGSLTALDGSNGSETSTE